MSSDTDTECWQMTDICSEHRVTLLTHPDAGFILCRCYTTCTEAPAPSVHSDEVLCACISVSEKGTTGHQQCTGA